MRLRFSALAAVCLLIVFTFARTYGADEVGQMEAMISSLKPDPKYPHDRFILVSLEEALAARRRTPPRHLRQRSFAEQKVTGRGGTPPHSPAWIGRQF